MSKGTAAGEKGVRGFDGNAQSFFSCLFSFVVFVFRRPRIGTCTCKYGAAEAAVSIPAFCLRSVYIVHIAFKNGGEDEAGTRRTLKGKPFCDNVSWIRRQSAEKSSLEADV